MGNNHIGITNELVIVEPRIIQVDRGLRGMISTIDNIRVTCIGTLLEVVARIVAVIGLDSTLAIESLTDIRGSHDLTETIDGMLGIHNRLNG